MGGRPNWAHLGKIQRVTHLSMGSWFSLVPGTSGISSQQGEESIASCTHFQGTHFFRTPVLKDRSQMLMAGEARGQGGGLSQEESRRWKQGELGSILEAGRTSESLPLGWTEPKEEGQRWSF